MGNPHGGPSRRARDLSASASGPTVAVATLSTLTLAGLAAVAVMPLRQGTVDGASPATVAAPGSVRLLAPATSSQTTRPSQPGTGATGGDATGGRRIPSVFGRTSTSDTPGMPAGGSATPVPFPAPGAPTVPPGKGNGTPGVPAGNGNGGSAHGTPGVPGRPTVPGVPGSNGNGTPGVPGGSSGNGGSGSTGTGSGGTGTGTGTGTRGGTPSTPPTQAASLDLGQHQVRQVTRLVTQAVQDGVRQLVPHRAASDVVDALAAPVQSTVSATLDQAYAGTLEQLRSVPADDPGLPDQIATTFEDKVTAALPGAVAATVTNVLADASPTAEIDPDEVAQAVASSSLDTAPDIVDAVSQTAVDQAVSALATGAPAEPAPTSEPTTSSQPAPTSAPTPTGEPAPTGEVTPPTPADPTDGTGTGADGAAPADTTAPPAEATPTCLPTQAASATSSQWHSVPAAKAAAQPAAVVGTPVAKPASAPATAAATAVAKPATPVAKPLARPLTKPPARPATKPATKPTAKPATKPAAKPATTPVPAPTMSSTWHPAWTLGTVTAPVATSPSAPADQPATAHRGQDPQKHLAKHRAGHDGAGKHRAQHGK